jgi:hypothetical protein
MNRIQDGSRWPAAHCQQVKQCTARRACTLIVLNSCFCDPTLTANAAIVSRLVSFSDCCPKFHVDTPLTAFTLAF